MTKRDLDAQLRKLSAAQYGCVASWQARALEPDARAMHRRVDAGLWERLSPRVFRLAGTPRSAVADAAAAVLDAGPNGALWGPSAVALFGVPGFDFRDLQVVRERARTSAATELAVLHEVVRLPPEQVVLINGIRTTRVAVSLLDVAGSTRPQRAERALDNALARRLTTVASIERTLAELGGRGRAGTALMRELAEARRGVRYPPTALERRTLELIREAGLPPPDAQIDLGDDLWIGRVDLFWRRWKGILEVDSELFHTSPLDREADAARDARLRRAGFTVARVAEAQVWYSPAEVIAVILRELAPEMRRKSA